MKENNSLGTMLTFYDRQTEEKYLNEVNSMTLRINQLVFLASTMITFAMSLQFLIIYRKIVFVVLLLCASLYTLIASYLIKKSPNSSELLKTIHGLIIIWVVGESLRINLHDQILQSDFSAFFIFYSATSSVIYTLNNFFALFILKVNIVIFTWFRFNQYSSVNVYIASVCSLLMILYCYQKEKKMRMFYLQTTSQHKYFTGYKQFLDKGLPIGVIVIQKQIESSKQAEEITVAFQNETFRRKFNAISFEDFFSSFQITGNQLSKVSKYFGRNKKRLQTKVSNDFEDRILDISNLKDLLAFCLQEQNEHFEEVNFNPLTIDFVSREINYEISVTECLWKKQKSFYVTFMDLSNQSKMLRLQELDKIKDNILATVSHDLKNPINSICNFLDIIHDNILSKKVIDQEVIEQVSICQSNGLLMQSQINDLQDFSMLKNFRFSLSIEQFNIQRLVQVTEQVFQFQCSQKMVKFITSINVADTELVTDPNRIKQVFYNLLGNAIKFSKQNGFIFIKITDDLRKMKATYTKLKQQMVDFGSKQTKETKANINFSNLIEICIEDNGFGIPLENQRQLFKMYHSFQRDGINKKGVGLGLVICKSLVGELGPIKFIHLDSQPEIITRFTFFIYKNRHLTLQKQPESISDDVDSEYIQSFSSPNQKMALFQPRKSRFLQARKIHALVIDDDPFACTATKLLLQQQENFEVAIQNSGPMGFDAIIKSLMEKSFFDIIFIDRNMPGLDGIQCVEKLKKIDSFKKARAQSKYKIIMVTGDNDHSTRNDCSKKGIDGFLSKPFSKVELQNVLKMIGLW